MPIYEYHCDGCGRDFEVMQKITDEPLNSCDACGSTQVSKLISASGFVLKGSGWYLTDYARKGSSGSASTESPAKAEKKSESKASADKE